MAYVALIEEVTAHAQSDGLEDARETCAEGTYFPNNLRILLLVYTGKIRLAVVFERGRFRSLCWQVFR